MKRRTWFLLAVLLALCVVSRCGRYDDAPDWAAESPLRWRS